MASFMISAVPEGVSIGLGILIFNFIVWLFRNFRGNNNTSKLPPGPCPWPVLGNLHMLGSLPHRTLTNLAKKYGPVMFLRLGSVPTVVVSSPTMAKEFLKTHDLVFADRPNGATAKLICYDRRDVAFAPYGGYWRQMKKLCTVELLTAKRIDSFKFVREEEVSAMIFSIRKESEQGSRCVDLSKTISFLTLNIVCRLFASRTYSDHELSGGHGFKTMIDELFAVAGAFTLGDFIPWVQWLDWQGIQRRMKKAHGIFDKFAEKVIDEHMSRRRKVSAEKRDQGGHVKDFVDVLLDMAETESEGTEMKITRVHIKAIILDVLNAGTETSSTTIAWAMSELLKNPSSLSRAQDELASVVGRHRSVDERDIASCEYLRCVVKETFRLHPPFPFLLPHESMEGCRVGGYYVPPRTRLIVNVWAIGRDGSVWEDPELFRPERFIGKNIDVRGQDFELLPFGTGRRVCPGIWMGLSAVELGLAQLLNCFDWSVEGDVNMEEFFGLTLPRKFPLLARPKWRLTTEDPVDKS